MVSGFEVFKAVTPFLIAYVVVVVWHTQKRKEVLANEAKNLILGLNNFKTLANQLHSYLMLVDGVFNHKECIVKTEELRKTATGLRSDLILFSELMGREDEYKKFITILDDFFIKLYSLSVLESWEDRFEDNDNYNLVVNFSNEAQPFKKKIISYALYGFHK
ncbi:hypothetical protein D3C80_1023410 [compost metagenome]